MDTTVGALKVGAQLVMGKYGVDTVTRRCGITQCTIMILRPVPL